MREPLAALQSALKRPKEKGKEKVSNSSVKTSIRRKKKRITRKKEKDGNWHSPSYFFSLVCCCSGRLCVGVQPTFPVFFFLTVVAVVSNARFLLRLFRRAPAKATANDIIAASGRLRCLNSRFLFSADKVSCNSSFYLEKKTVYSIAKERNMK